MKFFGYRCAANYLAAFKHQRFQSRFREIVSSDEAVVSGADDDYSVHQFSVYSFELWNFDFAENCKLKTQNFSFRIIIAAFRPLAPMMPPPGCVAEPHM